MAAPVAADTLRIATFNVELGRDGPGLLLRDVLKGDDPGVTHAQAVVNRITPDILHLTGFDYDQGLQALSAFNAGLAEPYAHLHAWRPNSGRITPFDLDGDGYTGGPADAVGYGVFAGQGGMAFLSRLPIDLDASKNLSNRLWKDLPGAHLPGPMPADVQDVLPLASVGLWDLVVKHGSTSIHLMAFHATPPVFDGPEDRNGLRNRDQLRFWSNYIDPIEKPFILLGDANADPMDGEARRDGLASILDHAKVQDPLPISTGAPEAAMDDGGANLAHQGDPAFDTVDWRDDPVPGNLRVDYVLPSTDWEVIDTGVFWPAEGDLHAKLFRGDARERTRHRLVWVDVRLKR